MQFASVVYLAFLALAVTGYFALPGANTRAAWLLTVSLAFYYSLSARWTLALLAVIAIGYLGGVLLERLDPESRSGRAAIAALACLVIAVLAVFKYTAFASTAANSVLASLGSPTALPVLRLALPVGISFWTFMTVAYLVDVSKRRMPAERNPVVYALYISFFPHVTAGPIDRPEHLLPQLSQRHSFSYERMRSALLLMGWGFFKKLLVADPLGVFVDSVYRDPHRFTAEKNGLVLAAATLAFAVQIYCDFSGYTDIVRGSARLFGIDLLRNFNRPYFARSVKEFWQRWHMTLMDWLKRYVYIPLGGSRVPTWRRYVNIATVFLVSGIWHGAGFTFIIWGLLNAAYQIVGALTQKPRAALRAAVGLRDDAPATAALQATTTFGLITIAWVFFRAESLGDALYIVSSMFSPTFSGGGDILGALPRAQAELALGCAAIVFLVDWVSMRWSPYALVLNRPLPVRWGAYLVLIFVIAVFGYYGPAYNVGDFAYFKF